MPSRSLLSAAPPPNLPIIRICKPCNSSFALDEPYLVSFLGLVATGSPQVTKKAWGHASKILDSDFNLQDALDDGLSAVDLGDHGLRVAVEPDPEIVGRVVEKNARGHLAFETGLVAPSDPTISCACIDDLPDSGTALFQHDHSWREVEEGFYRYVVITEPALIVRAVIWEYLATEVMWYQPEVEDAVRESLRQRR